MLINYFKKIAFELVFHPLIRFFDFLLPKNNSYWGFTVHHIKSDQFIENARAVFETIKGNSEIKKIIFLRNSECNFEIENANNTLFIKLKSLKGVFFLLRCKVIFVTHSMSMDYSLRWSSTLFSVLKINLKKHIVVNLWHGIPLKKLYALWNPNVRKRLDRVKFRHKERRCWAGLISSSKVDSYAMATMFHPIKYEQIWLTGLPRNDFLMREFDDLPSYLKKQILLIKKIKNGKKLIVYAPTYRQTTTVQDAAYYQFSELEIESLKKILVKHNAVFGFRMHYFRNDKNLFNMEKYIDNNLICDLGHQVIAEIAPVIRESDLMISDYSSVFIEALYLNKPVIGFTYDLDNYKSEQDGILYDFEIAFPGSIVQDFSSLLRNLDDELTRNEQTSSINYQLSRKFFYDYIDEMNSIRVIEKVKKIIRSNYE